MLKGLIGGLWEVRVDDTDQLIAVCCTRKEARAVQELNNNTQHIVWVDTSAEEDN